MVTNVSFLFIRYFIESWGYLKPIFQKDLSAYPSFLRPKEIPELDWFTCFCLRMLWYFAATCRSHRILLYIFAKIKVMHLLMWFHTRLMAGICRKMEASGINWEKARQIPIPEFDWKNRNPEEFNRLYGQHPHPVVLRGFLKDGAVMKYTFDHMVNTYGEETVILTDPVKDGYVGKLKDVMNPKIYLHNSEVLFNKYPQIMKDLEAEKLEPYLKGKKNGYSQLFVGRQGTGAPLHNAGTWNFFYMVDGTKRWYFVDPYDFYMIYPIWMSGHSAASLLPLYPDQVNEELYPAVKYCPYYYADLEPGDVLLNPPWWGHGIKNTSDKSVGVATRWYVDGVVGSNLKTMEDNYDAHRFGSFIFLTGPKSVPFLQEVLYEPSPKFDEHVTVRERHGRFIDKQKLLAEGKVDFEGYKPTF